MAGETSVTSPSNGRSRGDLFGGVGSFGQNLLSLAGLQAQLFSLDMRASLATATPAIVVLAVTSAAIFASLVVGIGGAAWWLATQLAWPLPVSLMLVSIVIITFASAFAVAAARRVQKSLQSFRRSTEELERNVAWVKTVLAQSGRE